MHKSQRNLVVIAARAAAQGPNLTAHNRRMLGPSTVVTATGHVKKTRCAKMTPAQRNSIGRKSEWSASTEFFTDPRWSQTVTSQAR